MSQISIQGTQKIIQTKLSACIIQNDASTLDKRIDLAKSLNLTNYIYNLRNDKDIDWISAGQVKDFCTKVNAQIDLVYDIIHQNSTTDLDQVTNFFNPGMIVWGFETIDQLPTNTAYINTVLPCIQRIQGKGIVNCLDAGLIYRNNSLTLTRNQACSSLQAESAKQYTQVNDRMSFTSDMNSNLSLLKNYFSTTLPTDWLSTTKNTISCINKIPGKKISDIQHHWEDTGENIITGTPLGNWAMGKMTKFILSNTDKINYFAWMSNQNLYNGQTPNPHYFDLKRVQPLFRFKNSVPVIFLQLGLDGILVNDASGGFALLITNETGNEYNNPISEISIPGYKITSNIRRDSGYSTSWNSITINESIQNESSFIIKPYSTSVFYFSGTKS